MKNILLIIICLLCSRCIYGQKNDTIYLSTINNKTGSSISDKNANLYFGFKDINFTDFCFLKDSNLIIHDTKNNTFILLDKDCNIVDNFNYLKKIRRLKYNYFPNSDTSLLKTPFYGINNNISYINDSTIFVSIIEKGSSYKLFYLTVANKKLKPILKDLDDYAMLFNKKSIGYRPPMIKAVYSSDDVIFASYETLTRDSVVNRKAYGFKDFFTISGYNYKTKSFFIISKDSINYSDYPTSFSNFEDKYLIANSLTKNLFLYNNNFICIDSLDLKPITSKFPSLKILSDIATNSKYLIVDSYNKEPKTIEYSIYKINAGLKIQFIKKIKFDRTTEIKTINNGFAYFPYVNDDDYKYYIYSVSLNETNKDSIFISYKGKKPPVIKNISVVNSQSNLEIIDNDFFMGLTIDDFTQMKKKEVKLFPPIERNNVIYPQSTIKELIESILLTSKNSDFLYMAIHLSMYENNYYKINFEKQRDELKKRIQNNTIYNYSEEEIDTQRKLFFGLLSNIENAKIIEKDNLTSIEVEIDDFLYIFIFIKLNNQYYIDKQFFKKNK